MKEFLIGAAGIIVAGAAIAHAPVATPAPHAGHAAHAAPHAMAPKAEKTYTRDEMIAKVRKHFAKLDADKDGFLTRAEVEAGRSAMKHRIVERMGERRDPAAAFDRLDANKDGTISREEFSKGHEMRMERRKDMKDGAAPGAPGAKAHKGMRMHRMGGMMMGGHMFGMADANKDGRVSLQEATDAAARHFDMADTNRDGRVTPDERRQMHRQMMEKHRAPKAS